MKTLYMLIASAGILMTLNKSVCWLGILLMIYGTISFAKEK